MPVATAASRLARSKLATAPQMELMGGDVDLDAFNLQMREQAGINLISAITNATVERTVEGASTLTVELDDDTNRTIQTSGRLGRKVDVNIDGLWFTLVGVKKTGRHVTLTFEEREVNLLRYYNSFLMASRSQVTRAQFALRMIKEVKEVRLGYVIPELDVIQPISDLGPNDVLISSLGQPLVPTPDPGAESRGQGIPLVAALTVKGAPATAEQIANANIILRVAVSAGADAKVQACSIMTAIAESRIINLQGGDLDSVGVFQQRRSQGWPATRVIATDAAAFIQRAMAYEKSAPNVTDAALCQAVQHSAFSDGSNYARWQAEAEAFVAAFGTVPQSQGSTDPAVMNNQLPSVATGAGQYFTRGQVTQKNSAYILTKENSWDCLQRQAQEVNWRCFCVSGKIYFLSEKWLFKSQPFMTISEDTAGVDWIDYDYDEGKRVATVTVSCHMQRWSAPPGSIVAVRDMGVIDGRWLVNDVNRSLYQAEGTITLKKPLPVLPEPTSLSSVPKSFAAPPPAGARSGPELPPSAAQAAIVAYARAQLGVPYQWGAEDPGISFDCSGLAQAAYGAAGISIPRVAQAQFDLGPKLSSVEILQPGDLVFFGVDGDSIEHVGVYVGGGAMIDAPHTGAQVRVDDGFTAWTDPTYVGATRPWAAAA